MKISVLTPTCRGKEGLMLVEKALKRQTFPQDEFEWIVVEPLGKTPPELYWQIYRDYNRGVKQCQGELVISWQDYTFAGPDCLERFWFHHQDEPNTIVSAVGNKYSDETFTVETWQDPRIRTDQGSYYQCFFNDIELNLASFPTKAFFEVGGFDEEMDKYSSLCGLDVLDRLNLLGGYDFKLDQTLKSYSLEHGRLPQWEEHNPFKNGAYAERRKHYLDNATLDYLP